MRKNNNLKVVEATLENLGFVKEERSYKDFMKGKGSVVDFIYKFDKRRSLSINYKAQDNLLIWASKLPLRQEISILNKIASDLVNKEGD